MALTERSRSALYQGLSVAVDDEQAVEEMLSYFPARDVEEPVTKKFLRAELAEFRAEVRGELTGLRIELHQELRRQQQQLIATMVVLIGLSTTILALVR